MAAAVDPATLHDEKLGFGKHRDKSFAEAAAEADYVEWALSMDRPKGRLATFCNYIKQTVAAPKVAVPTPSPQHRLPVPRRRLAQHRACFPPRLARASSRPRAPLRRAI